MNTALPGFKRLVATHLSSDLIRSMGFEVSRRVRCVFGPSLGDAFCLGFLVLRLIPQLSLFRMNILVVGRVAMLVSMQISSAKCIY